MSSYTRASNRMVTCPYDESHRCKESRLQMHIAKCKLNHLDSDMKTCPFNAQHRLDPGSFNYHLMNCPDRAVLDKKMAASVDRNNVFKGRLSVPSYSQDLPDDDYGECWDDDINPNATAGYTPSSRPPNDGIIQPSDMSKRSERKKFYQDLHKMRSEPEHSELKENSAMHNMSSASSQRQPKHPSEAQLYHTNERKDKEQFQNLSLGRGTSVSSNRIAANIFGQRQPSYPPLYSDITHGLSSLGLGRGTQNSASVSLISDSDFPVLGIGRGARRGTMRNGAVRDEKY